MHTCRKKAAKARARNAPRPTTKHEEKLARVGMRIMAEGGDSELLDVLPDLVGLPPKAAEKVTKKVETKVEPESKKEGGRDER